jgi:hypothetical protein
VLLVAGNWGYVVFQSATAAFAFTFLSGIVLKHGKAAGGCRAS